MSLKKLGKSLKKKRKNKPPNYRNLAIKQAKALVRKKANYTCEKCGRSKAQGYKTDGAHIIPVSECGLLAADPYDIICMCVRCHTFGGKAAHQYPHEFVKWFDIKFPGRHEKLKKINMVVAPIKDYQWKEIYDKLKEEFNNLMEE
jgi:hypothetical protein